MEYKKTKNSNKSKKITKIYWEAHYEDGRKIKSDKPIKTTSDMKYPPILVKQFDIF